MLSGGIEYYVLSHVDRTVYLKSCTSEAIDNGTLTIPGRFWVPKYGYYTPYRIDSPFGANQPTLSRLNIPPTIKSINTSTVPAFTNCPVLNIVYAPAGITTFNTATFDRKNPSDAYSKFSVQYKLRGYNAGYYLWNGQEWISSFNPAEYEAIIRYFYTYKTSINKPTTMAKSSFSWYRRNGRVL